MDPRIPLLMKILIGPISLLLFSVISVFAQTDFRSGYVITLTSDTISGEIDYRSNAKNYKIARFRKDGRIADYAPEQLLGYGFVNDKFYSTSVVPGAFVEVLVQGEMSLYKHGALFFIRKTNGGLHTLEYREVRERVVDGLDRIQENMRWKGLIVYMMFDCPPKQTALKALTFDERKLTKVVKSYNLCKKAVFVDFKARKPWTKFSAGISLGATNTHFDVEAPGFPYLADRYSSSAPTFGFVLGVSSPRLSERFAFQPEVNITKTEFSSFVVRELPSVTAYHSTSISLSTVSVPVLLKYAVVSRACKVHVLAGAAFDFHRKSQTHVSNKFVRDNAPSNGSEIEAFRVKKDQMGAGGGLSLERSFKGFELELFARYFRMGNLNELDKLETKTGKLSFGLVVSTN
jgi:hypothetical protein